MNTQLKTLFATSLLFVACSAPQNHDQAAQKSSEKKEDDFKIVLNSKPTPEATSASGSATPETAAASPAPVAAPTLKWSYTGDLGPTHWAQLDPQYALCQNGETQSPIDLKWKKPTPKQAIKADYQPSLWRVMANDLSLKVEFSKSNFLTINGKAFELQDALFHVPAEHTIAGKNYDGEIELIHRSTTGEIAVVSVLLRKGTTELPQLTSVLEKVGAKNQMVEVTDTMLDPSKWLPTAKTHYQYSGSLTFPPCTENIWRIVYNTAMSISDAQFDKLTQFGKDNARPVQTVKSHKVENF